MLRRPRAAGGPALLPGCAPPAVGAAPAPARRSAPGRPRQRCAPRDSAARIISGSCQPRRSSAGTRSSSRRGTGKERKGGRAPQVSAYLAASASALSKTRQYPLPLTLDEGENKTNKRTLLTTSHQQVN